MENNIWILSLLLLTWVVLLWCQMHQQKKEYRNRIRLLEELIRKRTRDFENSDSKIKAYAYMNSHDVRGPLARILGMVHLIDIHSVSADEGYARIKEAAVQLDNVIRVINTNLDEENDSIKSIKHPSKIHVLKKLA